MRRLTVLGLILFLGSAIWLLLPGSDTDPVAPPAVEATGTGVAPPAATRDQSAGGQSEDRPEQSPLARTENAEDPRPRTVLVGRCVDEDGGPLAGVLCMLTAYRGRDAVSAWEAEHGSLEWERPGAQTTGADGRFRLEFWAAPPLAFRFGLRPPAGVALSSMHADFPAGTVDLGDVRIERGVHVTGRVLDAEGVPLDETIELRLQRPRSTGAARGSLQPERQVSAATEADGSFRSRHPLLWGPHTLRLPQRFELVDGGWEMMLFLREGMDPLEIRVRRPRADATIEGVVVDATGRPLQGVAVQTPGEFRNSRTWTEPDGSFRLQRGLHEESFGEFPLQLSGAGMDTVATEERFSWGDTGLRLVARRGIDLQITVLRAGSLEPVQRYAAYLIPDEKGPDRVWRSTDHEPRGGWVHPEGRLHLQGLPRGDFLLRIEPHPNTELGESAFRPVQLRGPLPIAVQVLVPEEVVQEVFVLDADGAAIEGATVDLLQSPTGEPIDEHTPIFGPTVSSSLAHARVRQEARSDASGRATLTGSPSRSFALRVTAPDCAPLFRSPFHLGENPVELRLAPGARLHVTIGPPEYLDALRRMLIEDHGEQALDQPGKRPSIALLRNEGGVWQTHPVDQTEPFSLGADGSAELTGIPPGTWDLQFRSRFHRELLKAGVVLRPGERQRLEFDRSKDIPRPLRGRVLLNGEPFDGELRLETELEPDPQGQARSVRRKADSYEEGWFDVEVPDGVQRVHLLTEHGPLPAKPAHDTRQGGRDGLVFAARSGSLDVLLVDPLGVAVPGTEIHWSGPGKHNPITRSDPDGKCRLFGAPGAYTGRLRIRSLRTDRAFMETVRRREAEGMSGQEARAGTMITLEPIQLQPGSGAEIVLQLPADWDR